jgi:hypothetical protein
VSRLALPHQSFTFAASALDLLDDPALATALSVTTRAGLAELPTAATPSGRSHDPGEGLFLFCELAPGTNAASAQGEMGAEAGCECD